MVEAGKIKQRQPAADKELVKETIESVDLNQALAGCGNSYLLTVNCDAMADAGIKSGDKIIVDRATKPGNGNIVIADINKTLLIRKLKLVNGKMQLMPDARLAPILFDHYDASLIWGVVTYVIHRV